MFVSFFWPLNVPDDILIGISNFTIDTALDGLLDPLSRCLAAESARRVTELRVDSTVQSRIDAEGPITMRSHRHLESTVLQK